MCFGIPWFLARVSPMVTIFFHWLICVFTFSVLYIYIYISVLIGILIHIQFVYIYITASILLHLISICIYQLVSLLLDFPSQHLWSFVLDSALDYICVHYDYSVCRSWFHLIHACVYELKRINCLTLVVSSARVYMPLLTCQSHIQTLDWRIRICSITIVSLILISKDASLVHLLYWSHAFIMCMHISSHHWRRGRGGLWPHLIFFF